MLNPEALAATGCGTRAHRAVFGGWPTRL